MLWLCVCIDDDVVVGFGEKKKRKKVGERMYIVRSNIGEKDASPSCIRKREARRSMENSSVERALIVRFSQSLVPPFIGFLASYPFYLSVFKSCMVQGFFPGSKALFPLDRSRRGAFFVDCQGLFGVVSLRPVNSYRAWCCFLNFLDRYSSLKTANATVRGVLGPNRFESRFHSIPGGKFRSHPKLFDATQIFGFLAADLRLMGCVELSC